MQPTIISGDEIVIDSCQKDNLTVGDIIVFTYGTQFICHRIKEIKTRENGERFLITQGDSRNQPDKIEVEPKFIVGKVVNVLRDKRKSTQGIISQALKRGICRILDCLKIKSICKEVVFNFCSHWINYSFRLPRKRELFSLVRFIDLPLGGILQKDKDFFLPLKDIGSFGIGAQLRKIKIAELEVARLDGTNQWTVISFQIKGLFSGTKLEGIFLDYCFRILAFLDVNELYFLADNDDKFAPKFLERRGAELIKEEDGRKLYLFLRVNVMNERYAKIEKKARVHS